MTRKTINTNNSPRLQGLCADEAVDLRFVGFSTSTGWPPPGGSLSSEGVVRREGFVEVDGQYYVLGRAYPYVSYLPALL